MFMLNIYVYFWTSYTKHQNLELLPNEYMQCQARRKIWGQLGFVPTNFFWKLVYLFYHLLVTELCIVRVLSLFSILWNWIYWSQSNLKLFRRAWIYKDPPPQPKKLRLLKVNWGQVRQICFWRILISPHTASIFFFIWKLSCNAQLLKKCQ